MLAFHQRAYMIKPVGKEDTYHYLGHFIHSKEFMDGGRSINKEKKMVTIPLCKLWRFEMLETIERLRWCYLSSKHCDITRPNDWGVTTADHQTLISGKAFIDNVLPVHWNSVDQGQECKQGDAMQVLCYASVNNS